MGRSHHKHGYICTGVYYIRNVSFQYHFKEKIAKGSKGVVHQKYSSNDLPRKAL